MYVTSELYFPPSTRPLHLGCTFSRQHVCYIGAMHSAVNTSVTSGLYIPYIGPTHTRSTYARTHPGRSIRTQVRTHARTPATTHPCTNTRTHACTHTHSRAYTYTYKHAHTRAHSRARTHARTNARTHARTHARTLRIL